MLCDVHMNETKNIDHDEQCSSFHVFLEQFRGSTLIRTV